MIIGLSGLAGSGKDFISDILVEKYGFVKIAFADPLKRICKEIFDFSDDQLWGPSKKRNEPDKRYFTGITRDRIVDYEDARILLILDKLGNGDFSASTYEPTHDEIIESLKVYLTPRFALQSLGTEWGRKCYPLIWSTYAFRIIDKLLSGGYHYDNKKGLYEDTNASPPRGVVISDARFRNEMDLIKNQNGKIVRIIGIGATTLTGNAALHSSETEQQSLPDSYFDYICHNDENMEKLISSLDKMLEQCSR